MAGKTRTRTDPAVAPAAARSSPAPGGLGPSDLFWFGEGRHYRVYEKLGAHLERRGETAGARFAVWAPNAGQVAVVGEFNRWDRGANALAPQGNSGIWEAFVPGIGNGSLYKYAIRQRHAAEWREKADPVGFSSEIPPRTASRVWDLAYEWQDGDWMRQRRQRNAAAAPISIYEVHLGSWMRVPEDGNRSLSYREIAPRLIAHVLATGFTHVEFLPVMEHPFFGSWGYQVTGFFSPSARYGEPQDFMHLVDQLHQNGIGVILDWVPSHFPNDPHGLSHFDGTALYEHADPRQGYHPDWHSCIFNYGRHEVRSFLSSSAMFWLDKYHADGLRVDAVASMLYLDYSRRPGEWIPNRYGGRENLEAMDFLRRLNEDIYTNYPDVQTVAEESTAWPMVSRPTYAGGLGFGMKWDMGWMHDTLLYFAHDPIHRTYHHSELTFRQLYATQENFVLPLSHDEVVHGKGSLLGRMPGDEWQRFANLRLLLGYMFGQNGKKLLFMGSEFGQVGEWRHDGSIDWWMLQFPLHAGAMQWVADLNRAYRSCGALHARDFEPGGFQWVDCNDAPSSVLSWLRSGGGAERVLVVCNLTPVVRREYRVGVPWGGYWREMLNSDAAAYAGSGQGNFGGVQAGAAGHHGLPAHLSITLPPLAAVFFHSPGPPS